MEWTVMLSELRTVIRSAAKYMTGFERRRFMATMAMSIVTVALVRQKRVWASIAAQYREVCKSWNWGDQFAI